LETAQIRAAEGGWKNIFGGAVSVVRGRLATNISIASLGRGHHVECKDMQELLEAEDELREASKNLTRYLQVAKTFNGQRILISYVNGEEQVHVSSPLAPAALIKGPVGDDRIIDVEPGTPSRDPGQDFKEFFLDVGKWCRRQSDTAVAWVRAYRFKPMHLTVIIPVLLALADWAVLEWLPAQARGLTYTVDAEGLPQFALGAPYGDVRTFMAAQGWRPVSGVRPGGCGNNVCPPWPEAVVCSSSEMPSCLYVWQKGGREIRIRATGADYSNQAFHDQSVCKNFSYSTRFGLSCRNTIPETPNLGSSPSFEPSFTTPTLHTNG
jgi:hypothetical protein